MKETTQPIATSQMAINQATDIDKDLEVRDGSLVTDASHEAAAACCSTSEQTACCEPTEKAACCGTASASGCGCR